MIWGVLFIVMGVLLLAFNKPLARFQRKLTPLLPDFGARILVAGLGGIFVAIGLLNVLYGGR